MKISKKCISAYLLLFIIQTAFGLEPLSEQEMKDTTGQSGIIGGFIGFSEAHSAVSGSASDPKKTTTFNLAYANQLKDLDKDIRSFNDVFKRMETKTLDDGWTYFEAEFTTRDQFDNPGEQLTYADVHDSPVESGIGLFGTGFQVQSEPTHVKMSGKVKIEFRP